MKEPGDREDRPYIACGNIGSGNVGAALAFARFMDNSQALWKPDHNGFPRPGLEGREGNAGREKLKPFIDLGDGCSVSSGRVICQVAIKNSAQPHTSKGTPIVTRAMSDHTFGQSKK
jgi:hypothetical protein